MQRWSIKTARRKLNAALTLMIKNFENMMFIVIDALDKYAKSGKREELLTLITEIQT
jgi:hypothetical protein